MAYTYQDSDRSHRLHVWDQTNNELLGGAGSDVTGTRTNSINVEDAASYLDNRDGASLHLDGLLDEVVAFNDVLTADEIDQIRKDTFGASSAQWDEVTYTYDPAGRRIEKDIDGETTTYVYDGGHCIAEYDSNDTLVRKYVHGPCIDEPVCMIDVEDSNAVYYYHYDALGSVVALSDADGDTVQLYEYSVYGQVAASDPNHPNPFLFTGRRFDTETGLYYYRARYYNPYIGRFLQTDPIGYGDGMNMYRYCANNPIGCVDPSGSIRIWRENPDGVMVPVGWRTPWKMTPLALITPPNGGIWTRNQFFWWYVFKEGDLLDFVGTGLVGKFMSNSTVSGGVTEFIADAKQLALEKYGEIDAAVREWLEWARRLRAGEELMEDFYERPDDNVYFEYKDSLGYDFGWRD